jgi:hypothetical protein
VSQDTVRLLWTAAGVVVLIASLYMTFTQFSSIGSRHVLRRFLLLAPLPPVILILLFYGFVLRARLELGYQPSMYHPDPKTLGFGVHHSMVWMLIVLNGLFPFVWLAASLAAWRVKHLRGTVLRTGPVTLAANAIAFLVFTLNPGHFLEWFAD